jgi:hypothetical protein
MKLILEREDVLKHIERSMKVKIDRAKVVINADPFEVILSNVEEVADTDADEPPPRPRSTAAPPGNGHLITGRSVITPSDEEMEKLGIDRGLNDGKVPPGWDVATPDDKPHWTVGNPADRALADDAFTPPLPEGSTGGDGLMNPESAVALSQQLAQEIDAKNPALREQNQTLRRARTAKPPDDWKTEVT